MARLSIRSVSEVAALLSVLVGLVFVGGGWVNRCVNGSGCDLPLIG